MSPLLAFISALFGVAADDQTDLRAFAGPVPDQSALTEACDSRIRANRPVYFPFCGSIIITHLGDRSFREFYDGGQVQPFLTSEQADAFGEHVGRVRALQNRAEPCLGKSLENCLARLSSALFLTSQPVEPKWVPGEPILETHWLHFDGYKLPVYDELGRFQAQLRRGLSAMITLEPGDVVSGLTLREKWEQPYLTSASKGGMVEALGALGCGTAGQGGLIAVKEILSVPLVETGGAMSLSRDARICGKPAKIFLYEAASSGLEPSYLIVSVSFREPRAAGR